MPPKKKKTQLKKVERGFATTSIPKKAPVAVAVPEETTDAIADEADAANADVKAPEPVLDDNTASLQRLVEKLQDKTEKEILRTLKTIEYDRRMTKGLPRLELDQGLEDEINALIANCDSQDKARLPGGQASRDKLLAQLGITYGVLRRLGFQDDVVLKCLKEASGVELDQAFDWLYAHCCADDLDYERRSTDTIEESTPPTPMTSDFSSSPSTPKALEKKPLPPSSSLSNGHPPTPTSESSSERSAAGPLAASKLLADESSGSGDTSDNDDPNVEYVRLKMRITELTGARRRNNESAENDFLKGLRARLEDVKKSYFFSERDAEASFQEKRKEVDEASLLARLRGDTALSPRPVKVAKKPPAPPQIKAEVARTSTDVFENEEEGSPRGMLDLLEPMPSTETSATGTTITVRDMALPKHWAGRTPKMLLLDLVTKLDRYAAVVYNDLSGGTRAKRASVIIRWTGGKADDWAMDDVACHDTTQADQYIATVALHALTYPPVEAFRSSVGHPKGAQTSYRHLPPAFRDLWNELEDKRKEEDNKVNRGIWDTLGSVLDHKLSYSEKVEDKVFKEAIVQEDRIRKGRNAPDYSPEQLMAGIQARQASFAYQEMLAQRNTLPIAAYRQTINEMLDMSQVVVLSGETGCGKSTQLPSFVLEDQLAKGQHCKIVVTEPRRISAISLAQRVSRELGDAPGAVGTNSSLVGYSIRLESHTSKNTRLTFVTNGIALRMLEGGTGAEGRGTAFDEITHIIVDEVHERSIESDFLLIVLKSLLEQRRDLKVILMSATLDADKISSYFGGCPTIHVPGRTFPIDVRYIEDAVEYTQWSIKDSSPYAKRINDKYHRNAKKTEWSEDLVRDEDDDDHEASTGATQFQGQRYSSSTVSTMNLLDDRFIPYDLIIRILETVCGDSSVVHMSAAFLVFMPGLGEIRRLNDMLSEHPFFGSDAFRVFPLHSMISSENQSAVFDIPPQGVRKIVIATNIAETGITIPDITCVIDSGKHREMRFDEKRQISRLIETFVARSNAAQRRGRAGRVQSGLSFHLFSKARHDMMAEHPLPEMLRLSLSDLALRIKIMKVNLGSSIEDALTRALDPPSTVNIQRAVSSLVEVQALTTAEEITPMGRLLSKLPTDVHLGKFLLVAALFRCLDPALTIAAALNSKSPFVSPLGLEHEADRAKNSFKLGDSDFLTIHNAFASWRKASANPSFVRKFCRQNYLSHQNLQQIEELRQQFLGYLVDSSFIKVEQDFVRELNRARYARGYRTRFILVPSEYDRNTADNMALLNAALCAGLYPKLLTLSDAVSGQKAQMRTLGNNQPVAFHPSSVNFRRRPQDFGVNFLNYFTIMHSKRLYAWETGPVDDMDSLTFMWRLRFQDMVVIDRKLRYRLAPKTSIALKYLRAQLAVNLATQFRGKELTEQQEKWSELAMRVLGKEKSQISKAEGEKIGVGLGISVR
ncbi:P-loop containing nucleoside triphosphate hydrolase protein [Phellopilus nigrolimitatus]|nr:P-loop containing nucleoside triphosphate hydrolase protein [Phellopilus nigrolimitatus]